MIPASSLSTFVSADTARENAVSAQTSLKLETIARAINYASNTGELTVEVYADITGDTLTKLTTLGYEVTQKKDVYDNPIENQYIISWENTIND